MKLFTLGLKQASKHVANAAKNRAKKSERFKSFIIRTAQFYHTVQTKSRLDVLGLGKIKRKVEPLTDAQALELGLEILGDTVIIGCALGIYLIFEARPRGTEKPEDPHVQEINNLKLLLSEQELQMAHMAANLRELERLIHSKTMYSEVSEKVMQDYLKSQKKS